jgi:arsenate reductase
MKLTLQAIVLASISAFLFSFSKPQPNPVFYPKLNTYCQSLSNEFNQITTERKAELEDIARFVVEQRKEHQPANLLFVCTSNSRRSHMAQVWAQIASYYFQVDSVFTFSGGTEQTRVHSNALEALKRAGMEIYSNNQGDNPLRYISISKTINPWAIFSKEYTNATNPSTNFAAIMVCTEADKACPYVNGALSRIGMPYQDPKEFDNSPNCAAKYDERCRQIAREMFYVFSKVKS